MLSFLLFSKAVVAFVCHALNFMDTTCYYFSKTLIVTTVGAFQGSEILRKIKKCYVLKV